ncbi:MAG: MMPL family transporter [Kiloniellales bacterium]
MLEPLSKDTAGLGVAFGAALGRWVGGAARRPLLVLVLAALTAAAAGQVTVERLSINTSTTDMLSAELPFRRNAEALKAVFPQFTDSLTLVVEAKTAAIASNAAKHLYAALGSRPETFRNPFYAEAEPFFRHAGLLYLEPTELQKLATRLADAQPFLAELAADPSLRGLAHLLALAAPSDDAAALTALAPALERFAETAEALGEGETRPLPWRALISGEQRAEEGQRQVLTVRPLLDYGSLAPAEAATATLRRLAAEIARAHNLEFNLRLTGSPILFQEELESVRQNIGLAGLLSTVLVAIVLWLGLRSVRLVAAILVTLALGLVWTACFATLAVGSLNLISVAFAVLFIGLSVDFGIHLALRAREGLAAGKPIATALAEAGSSSGPVLGLCALTTVVGFLAFLPTDYRGLAELGVITAGGIAIALVANLTMVPAVMALLPPAAERTTGDSRLSVLSSVVEGWLSRHARWVVGLALLLALAASVVLPSARFDDDPLNLRDPESESVATLVDLLDDETIEAYDASVLVSDLSAAKALAAKLEALPEVASATTLADLVPDEQEAKLAIIEDMGFFLVPLLTAGTEVPPPTAQERTAAVEAMIEHLNRLQAPAIAESAGRFAASLDGLEQEPATLERLERLLLGGLEPRLSDLALALSAQRIALEDLPEGLRDRFIAADGRALVRILPAEDLRDQAARRRFVDSVQAVAPGATGAPIIITEAGRAVVASFLEAAALTLVLVVLLLMLLLRSATATLTVLVPLGLAALLTVASTVVLQLPFNFANVIVMPLLFGLGIDSGLHLVTRAREAKGAPLAATSTPRAVLLSALTTIASFCSLAISSHRGMASMGILLTIAIGFTLATTLLLLPALLALLERRRHGVRQ